MISNVMLYLVFPLLLWLPIPSSPLKPWRSSLFTCSVPQFLCGLSSESVSKAAVGTSLIFFVLSQITSESLRWRMLSIVRPGSSMSLLVFWCVKKNLKWWKIYSSMRWVFFIEYQSINNHFKLNIVTPISIHEILKLYRDDMGKDLANRSSLDLIFS